MITANNSSQPKAFYLLFFANMWECFSYYGMRSILVLFIVKQLNYSDSYAFAIYAVYSGLIEVGGIIGGYIADRILGIRRAIIIGMITIMLGHTTLIFINDVKFLYIGLSLIIIGTTLFRVNCTSLFGMLYSKDDPRRDTSFTAYYMAINIGALLATILCSYAAEYMGWHYGFSIAAIGMFMGVIIFALYQNVLGNHGIKQDGGKYLPHTILATIVLIPIISYILYKAESFLMAIPLVVIMSCLFLIPSIKKCSKIERRNILILLAAIVTLVFFYALEELLGTTMTVFFERNVNREVAGHDIPAAALISANPIMIIIGGAILAKIFAILARSNILISGVYKLSIAFILMASAFGILYISCLLNTNLVPLIPTIIGISVIAFAELFIGPTLYNLGSKLAPNHMRGETMGLVVVGYSCASLLSGKLAQYIGEDNLAANTLATYQTKFAYVAIACIIVAVLIVASKLLVARKRL